MTDKSSGGVANWSGAAFELRLGVEFCVYILIGDAAGLGPGAATRVQLQAPEPVDDLVLEFETGTRWAVQAKAGSSVRVEWNPDRPFGKALAQLYRGATGGQIDLAPDSLDRVELAVDHQAPQSLTRFSQWLSKARHHLDWEHFAATCTSKMEREFVQQLPAFLDTEGNDQLLAFLKRLRVRREPDPDEWWNWLRGRLIVGSVPEDKADVVLNVLLAQVAAVAPHAGQLDAETLQRACAHIKGVPGPIIRVFRLFEHPDEDALYQALDMPPVRVDRFVPRPELAEALTSETGVLVAGKPGIGKSHALIRLALAQPDRPVVVIARSFRPDDVSSLTQRLRRIGRPYQLLWDNVHGKPDLFADVVERLAERGDPVRVLAAYRDHAEEAVKERCTPDFCRRAGLPREPVRLHVFDDRQAAEMTEATVAALDLKLNDDAQRALAEHVRRGDGGPLFAVSIGLLLREQVGQTIRAGDVSGLPDELFDTWRNLYQQLTGQPNGFPMQSLLHCLRFLHQIGCPLDTRLAELLYTQVMGHSRGELMQAAEALARGGWLRRDGDQFSSHDVTLEAVPEDPERFRRFAELAHEGMAGEDWPLGLLRGSLSSFFWGLIPYTTTLDQRQSTVADAVGFGNLAVENFRTIEMF